MLKQKSSSYSPSERAALDVLKDADRDLCSKEISEQCDFTHSTICKALKSLAKRDKVIATREVGQATMYQSRSIRQLQQNMNAHDHNGESAVKSFVLNTLEHANQDISAADLVQVSGYSRQRLLTVTKQLAEDGEITMTREVDGNALYIVE